MPDRMQTRLEKKNLNDINGYVGRRLTEMAVYYVNFLGGRPPSMWLREVAAELIRRAERLDAQDPLGATQERADPIVVQVMRARSEAQIDHIRDAYLGRWTDVHDAAREAWRAEHAV